MWLVNSIKDDDIAGGFLPRFLVFCAPKRDKSLAFQPPSNKDKQSKLIAMLSKIDKIRGELKFSEEAIQYYTDWYKVFENATEKLPGMLVPFNIRLADYAKKFSMVFWADRSFPNLNEIAMSDGDYWITDQKISIDDMKKACLLAESYAEELSGFMDVEISFSYKEKIKKRVEKSVRARFPGSVSRSDLLKESRLSTKDLSPILETLEDEHKIKIEETQVAGIGRRKIYTQQAIFWLNLNGSR